MNLSQISQICSLEKLIQGLAISKKKDASYYNQLIQSINLSSESLHSYCTWNPLSYTRNLVCSTDIYQLLILCWQAGQASPIHDHQDQDCWMYIVKGIIEETLYQPIFHQDRGLILHETDKKRYQQGNTSRLMNSTSAWHSIQAISEQVITLHLYSLPIKKCQIYDLKTGQFSDRELNYS
jgi:cysteine dioxygenase